MDLRRANRALDEAQSAWAPWRQLGEACFLGAIFFGLTLFALKMNGTTTRVVSVKVAERLGPPEPFGPWPEASARAELPPPAMDLPSPPPVLVAKAATPREPYGPPEPFGPWPEERIDPLPPARLMASPEALPLPAIPPPAPAAIKREVQLASVPVAPVAPPAVKPATARIYWDHAQARFPADVRVQAGTAATATTRVFGPPPLALGRPGYRVRYAIRKPAPNVQPTHDEVTSDAAGHAKLIFRQQSPRSETAVCAAQLVGRNPSDGHEAIVLAEQEFRIEWVAPKVELAVKRLPPVAPGVEQRLEITPAARSTEFADGLRLWLRLPRELEVNGRTHPGQVDLGGWTPASSAGVGPDIALRGSKPGKYALHLEVRQGEHVWASHQTEFVVAGTVVLALTLRDAADPVALGGAIEYQLEVENRGTAAARQVALEAIARGLRLIDCRGTLKGGIDTGQLKFEPIAALAPGARMNCVIRAKPAAAGEARLSVRASLKGAGSRTIQQDESTTVYLP